MSTTPIQHAKQRLRRCLIEQRTLLSPEQINHASAAITAHVCAMSVFRASQTIMVYMALPHEVQTTDLILEAQLQHKRIAVPSVTAAGLVALQCPALAQLEGDMQSTCRHFRQGPYGILEPRDTSAVISTAEIDLVLVPGVGFDGDGNRLGYGAGYYDRFLKQLPVTTNYGGMAFHMQMVSHIPSLPHDVSMPFVVTEQGQQLCSPNSHSRDRIDKGEHR